MQNIRGGTPPDDPGWQFWVDAWDRMQECYVVKRSDRFETIVHLIRDTQPCAARILDLGCGTGSLMSSILEALPESEAFGIDFEPAVMRLAQARLWRFCKRAHGILADLRDAAWTEAIPCPIDAVVTAMTFHCFSPERISALYQQIAPILSPGGIFLNADHVGSDSPIIQEAWKRRRATALTKQANPNSEDWEGFWQKYTQALGLDLCEIQLREKQTREGHVEGGLSLAWHFDRLREAGFISVDCFWRCDTDAVYGGMRGPGNAEQRDSEF